MFSFKAVSFINCGMVQTYIEKVYIIVMCYIPIALNIFSCIYRW